MSRLSNYSSSILPILKKQLFQARNADALLKAQQQLPKISFVRNNIPFDLGHIKEYADVCGFKDIGDSVPIMYPAMMCLPLQMQVLVNKDFPFPVMGLVHLANKIEQFEPLRKSSAVSIEVSLGEKLLLHDKGYVCDIVCKVFAHDTGRLLWCTTQTLFKHQKRDKSADSEKEIYDSQIKQDDVQGLKEMERWTVPSDQGRRYAAVSGDYNPIHLSSLSARLFGFTQGAIVHGMWTKARAVAALLPPPDSIQPSTNEGEPMAQIYTEFKTPLFLPSEVVLSADTTVEQIIRDEGVQSSAKKHNSTFEVKSTSGDNLPHMRGRCVWYE